MTLDMGTWYPNNYNQYPINYCPTHTGKCPSCGYCPCCGRNDKETAVKEYES